MGYGANRSDLQRVGGSGDGGIDGVISLDKLGLEKVDVQAKRWQNTVGEVPFSFIPAKEWSLFYFRRPAVRSSGFDEAGLRASFPDALLDSAGEWTVRIRSMEDVRRLWKEVERIHGAMREVRRGGRSGKREAQDCLRRDDRVGSDGR